MKKGVLGLLLSLSCVMIGYSQNAQKGNDRTQIHMDKAMEYSQSGKPDRAIAEYKKAIAILPRYASPYFNMGLIYFQTKRYDLAKKQLLKHNQIIQTNGDAYTLLARMVMMKDDTEKALGFLKKAEEAAPQYAVNMYNITEIYIPMEQYEKAMVTAKKARKLAPDLDNKRMAQDIEIKSSLYLSLCYHQLNMPIKEKELNTFIISNYPIPEELKQKLKKNMEKTSHMKEMSTTVKRLHKHSEKLVAATLKDFSLFASRVIMVSDGAKGNYEYSGFPGRDMLQMINLFITGNKLDWTQKYPDIKTQDQKRIKKIFGKYFSSKSIISRISSGKNTGYLLYKKSGSGYKMTAYYIPGGVMFKM